MRLLTKLRSHIGDASKHSKSTSIVVGPGFRKAFLPGYPANPESPVLESDFESVQHF